MCLHTKPAKTSINRKTKQRKIPKWCVFCEINYTGLLVIAPEHLNDYMKMSGSVSSQSYMKTGNSPISQKGDVYSFAIILQELILRADPFENDHMDVEGTLCGSHNQSNITLHRS